MIKYALEKWEENKEVLRNTIQQTEKNMRSVWDYEEIVKLTCHCIFNEKVIDGDPKINIDGITMIDNGDYQGTLLFMLPFDTDQPAEYEYLMTYVGYGSCSGCDTLQRIQLDEIYYNDETEKDLVDSYLSICKDIVSNTIRPYNQGWRNNGMFEPVEYYNNPKRSKVISKESLYYIISEWLKPELDSYDLMRDGWCYRLSNDGFFWQMHYYGGNECRDIGVCICHDDNDNSFIGYNIWTYDIRNVNIRIREDSIKFIEDSEFKGFAREEMKDLYDRIKTQGVVKSITNDVKDKHEETKTFTKKTLCDIITNWLRTELDKYESSDYSLHFDCNTDNFDWYLSHKHFHDQCFGVRLFYDRADNFIGYAVWTCEPENVNIEIRKDSIEFIEESEFKDFSKEEMKNLYYKIKQEGYNLWKDNPEKSKIITKESLRHIMSDWIKPKTDECESLRGEWTSGSDVDGHFSWHLRIGARFCDIGMRLCYNNKNEFTGYDVWTHNRVNVNIRIRKDIIEFIENSEFQSFTKEEMKDLYDKINAYSHQRRI